MWQQGLVAHAIIAGRDFDESDRADGEKVVWANRRFGAYMQSPFVYGDELYVCRDNGVVTCWDAKTGEQVLYQSAHNDWVLGTVFSTDSSHLVTVSRDRSMKLYEVATERFVDNVTSITPGALKGGLHAVDRHPTKDELF